MTAPPPRERSLRAEDGVRIDLSERASGRATAVVVAPGFFRSRRSPMLEVFQERLERRHDVFTLDFRGHGTSAGRYTFGVDEGRDLRAVLTHVRSLGHDRVGVVGFSMGGLVAITALGRLRRDRGVDPAAALGVRALVTISSPSHPDRIRIGPPPPGLLRRSLSEERDRWPRLDPIRALSRRPDARRVAHALSPIPVLVIHNRGDWLVPDRMAHEIHDACREPRRLHLFENGGRYHADALVRDIPDELFAVVEPFLAEHLGDADGPADGDAPATPTAVGGETAGG